MGSTEPVCTCGGFEAARRPVTAFGSAVVLLQMIVPEFRRAVLDVVTKHRFQGRRVAGVLVGGDPLGVMPLTAMAERKNASAATWLRVSLR